MSESNASPLGRPGGKQFREIASKRYGGALDVPAFRWLWLLSLFSAAGDAIATVAMPLLVYDLTGSAGLLGAMVASSVRARRVRRSRMGTAKKGHIEGAWGLLVRFCLV